MVKLDAESAKIFRITHIENVPWILGHGLHCKNSSVQDPNFISIGMAELINKRMSRSVQRGPKGMLSDYVPFYFTPYSIMMYNIRTGYNGVTRRENSEIAILVSSLHKLKESEVHFVFTNGHAFMAETEYFDDLADLGRVDWELLRNKDFKKDPEDPGKTSRYQAEALVHRQVPVDALLGIALYDETARQKIEAEVKSRGLSVPVKSVPGWYF
jgi:ssDNA thymidine ADP-ribosyltransferase, DarT